MNPRVQTAKAEDDFSLILTFTNGEVRRYAVKPHLKFGVFAALKDLNLFKQAKVVNGTVVWPGEVDICPDTLYQDSQPMSP